MIDIWFLLKLLFVLVVIMANSVLAITVHKNNTRSATNKILTALCILTTAWLLVIYLSTVTQQIDISLWLVRLNVFLAVPQVLAFYLLATTLPHPKINLSRLRLAIISATSLIVMAITISPYTFTSVQIINGQPPQPVVGWGIAIFMAQVVVLSLATIVTLIQRIRHSRRTERQQLLFVAYGVVIMLGLIITTIMIPAVLFQNTSFVSLAPAYVLAFLAMTSYAIIRHHLLDIRVIVVRSVTYSLTVSILLIAYTAIIFGISRFFYGSDIDSSRALVNAILAIFVGATFQPLKHWLQHLTERIFFQTHYDSSDLILKITKTLASTYDLDKLSNQVVGELLTTIHIERGAMVVAINGKLEIATQKNMSEGWLNADVLTELGANRHVLEAEDIKDGSLLKSIHKSHLSVIVPLYVGQDLQGMVVLGDKQSGEIYTGQDLKVLDILSRELAVAVESARNFKQISTFNSTLRREVDKATKELRSANEQLSRKNHQLEQLDKLKDEFISVTSHELRTPLTAIRGYLWMVINGKKDASYKMYLDRAYVSAERLIELVNDTLDISRIESGRVQLSPESTKLPELVKQVLEELAPKALESNQSMTIKSVRNLPLAMCDPDKIHQVLTNLIGNALKFTPSGGKITVNFYVDKHNLVTAITDTGPGISAEDQKKLFQKFSRLASTSGIPGTGLGLYLCQRFIALSKGKIWIDSQVGQGSTFFFSLPISDSSVVSNSPKSHMYHHS